MGVRLSVGAAPPSPPIPGLWGPRGAFRTPSYVGQAWGLRLQRPWWRNVAGAVPSAFLRGVGLGRAHEKRGALSSRCTLDCGSFAPEDRHLLG